MSKRVIICDLDDTLVDARWRMKFWGDWDRFYAESARDEPITQMCDMVRYLCSSFKVIILTAREERYRPVTQKKLDEIGVWHSGLVMSPNDRHHICSPELKIMMAEKRLGPTWRERVNLVIDDREDVLSAFRAQGVMTLQATYPNSEPARSGPSMLEKVS